ncbi:MAG: B12-binding domain-containing radical SAM protein, partial [Clostridium sp.]|nr:B12-binding domain-containing radical SAM protein [Clostridium sp.]
LAELPKVLPGTDIWLGGPEASFEAEKLLKEFPTVRGIMAGEGEETFKELLTFYVAREQKEIDGKYHDLREIPGLVLAEGATAPRGLTDMNRLPFLYDDLQGFENKIIYYETSRGCPFRCSYCLSSIDKQVRLRNLDMVKKELQFFLDKKTPQVKLIDRTFNCNRNHAMEIWRYIKEHDNGVTNFHFEIAAELLGEEEFTILTDMRPGLVQLEIGVQTTNKKTLKEINRGGDIARIARAVGAINEGKNIHIHLDLIAGLPFEGYDSFKNSFNEVYAMRPLQLQLGFLKVLKGTAIWEKAKEYGIVYQEGPPYEVLYTKWITYEEILKLKQVEEMVEIYYNSSQFTYTLPVLEKLFPGPFDLYAALADYYEEKGYFINAPARSRRYQVLLEFAKRIAPEGEELYGELLTFDFYLRENAKSRPNFSADLSKWRKEIWEFYQKEEAAPELLKNYRQYHARQTMKMTHMEAFYYPVWESGKAVLERGQRPEFVLFDYGERDALTGNARVQAVSLPADKMVV